MSTDNVYVYEIISMSTYKKYPKNSNWFLNDGGDGNVVGFRGRVCIT